MKSSFALAMAAAVVSHAFGADADACRVDDPAIGWSLAAESLIESLPPRSVADLHEKGYVFPPEGIVPRADCAEMVQVLVLFDVPPDVSMRLLGQTYRQGEYLRNLQRVSGVMNTEHESIVQHELKILFRMLRYQLHYHVDAERQRIWWGLEPSYENDLRDIRGYWQFVALEDDRTLAVYATVVDVGPVLPKRMQASLTRKNLRESLQDIRHWVHIQGGEPR